MMSSIITDFLISRPQSLAHANNSRIIWKCSCLNLERFELKMVMKIYKFEGIEVNIRKKSIE